MRTGVRVGVDVGRVRIGVSRSDDGGLLATPVETVRRADGDVGSILNHVVDVGAIEIVVGLPLSLSGNDTASTDDAREFAKRIAARSAVPVRLVDERLSTVSAHQALRGSGRSSRRSRAVIDQVAAVIILQHALDVERSGGIPPGTLVDPDGGI